MQSQRCVKYLCTTFSLCPQATAGDRLDKRALFSECILPHVDPHLVDISVIAKEVGCRGLYFSFLFPRQYRINDWKPPKFIYWNITPKAILVFGGGLFGLSWGYEWDSSSRKPWNDSLYLSVCKDPGTRKQVVPQHQFYPCLHFEIHSSKSWGTHIEATWTTVSLWQESRWHQTHPKHTRP